MREGGGNFEIGGCRKGLEFDRVPGSSLALFCAVTCDARVPTAVFDLDDRCSVLPVEVLSKRILRRPDPVERAGIVARRELERCRTEPSRTRMANRSLLLSAETPRVWSGLSFSPAGPGASCAHHPTKGTRGIR